MRKQLEPEIKALLQFVNGQCADGLPSDMQGTAASSAATVLLQDWQISLSYRPREAAPLLIEDIDLVIAHLSAFKVKALAIMPPEYGGHASAATTSS
jgi:hypothetical protein